MQTRRTFLSSLGAAGVLGATSGCATTRSRTFGILDTHTHFYDPTRPQGVPWPPKDDAFLYRTVLPDELKSTALPLGVMGTIVVEASPWVEDNAWLLQLAKNEPFIRGLVGHLRPGDPNYAHDLNRFAADRLFRGIRTGLWNIPINPDNSDFLRDLRLLADRGLSLDLLGGPDQLPRISRLAQAIPDLRIIIDHCAGVQVIGGEPAAAWIAQVRQVAENPNVHMKVSGLVEGTSRQHSAPSDVEFYRPVLDVIWDAFGEDRLIYGSNWPVSARFASYQTALRIVSDYFRAKPEPAAEKYFVWNAERIYLGSR